MNANLSNKKLSLVQLAVVITLTLLLTAALQVSADHTVAPFYETQPKVVMPKPDIVINCSTTPACSYIQMHARPVGGYWSAVKLGLKPERLGCEGQVICDYIKAHNR